MAYYRYKDIEIYYEIHGTGEPLVLVAGLASDSQSWLSVRDQLASQFQLIIFDNRCVGRTTPQVVNSSGSLMADDCMALIKHLGLTKVNLLGHSMGSYVAIECAVQYPEMVDKLMLAGSATIFLSVIKPWLQIGLLYRDSGMDMKVWFRNLFYWLFSSNFFNDSAMIDIAIDCAISYPHQQCNDALKKQIQSLEGYSVSEKLANVLSKSLVIGGEYDLIFPKEDSYKLAGMLPNAECKIISGAAHSIHAEKPEAFVGVVKQFLSGRN